MANSSSYYESLLNDFEHQSIGFTGAQSEALAQRQGVSGVSAGGQMQPGVGGPSCGISASSDGGSDYFASFAMPQSVAVPERVDAPVRASLTGADTQEGKGLAGRVRDLFGGQSRQRAARGAASAGRAASWLLFSDGSIARFLRTVAIIAVLALVLWNARYAIGDVLVGIASTLGPIALVVYVIYRMIRIR